jgi:hypothetical protein
MTPHESQKLQEEYEREQRLAIQEEQRDDESYRPKKKRRRVELDSRDNIIYDYDNP